VKKSKIQQDKKRKLHEMKQAEADAVSKKRQRDERRERYRQQAIQERVKSGQRSGQRGGKRART